MSIVFPNELKLFFSSTISTFSCSEEKHIFWPFPHTTHVRNYIFFHQGGFLFVSRCKIHCFTHWYWICFSFHETVSENNLDFTSWKLTLAIIPLLFFMMNLFIKTIHICHCTTFTSASALLQCTTTALMVKFSEASYRYWLFQVLPKGFWSPFSFFFSLYLLLGF